MTAPRRPLPIWEQRRNEALHAAKQLMDDLDRDGLISAWHERAIALRNALARIDAWDLP